MQKINVAEELKTRGQVFRFRCLVKERSVSLVAVVEFGSDDMTFAVIDRDKELSKSNVKSGCNMDEVRQ